MRSQAWNLFRGRLVLGFKFGSVALLFIGSVLIVACGSVSDNAGLGSPAPTLTINLSRTFASPTPPLAPYLCAAWATQSSPTYYQNSVVMVYAKYVKSVNGNPMGMGNAHAQATVLWPAGAPTMIDVTTTSDGLAVFQVPLQPSAVGRMTLVEVNFTSQDGQHTCNVSGVQDAFFTAIYASPTPSSSPSPTDTPSTNPSPTGTPSTGNPTVNPTTGNGG
ncbi:MAG TPA: hypothetical protein VGD98_14790 [Ktedonobacteraceae bacterium]